MPAHDPVTELIGRLDRSVVGSARRRREVVAEIEGDLREAVAGRTAAGQPASAAAAAVAAEFGDPRNVAAALSLELLAARGRRFTTLTAIGVVALLIAWYVGMTTIVGLPGFRLPAESGWMLQVSTALDVAGPLLVGTAVVAWFAIRRWGSPAALAAVAVLQLGFTLVLVAGAVAMAATLAVPAAGMTALVVLVAFTVVLGAAMTASSTSVLLRWVAVSREPRRARS
ncbi:permease prefix domain 1-containing protein [Agrococcus sp. Ld7]|uniref:permease prefix domain 1-containing protein n=1 Tax=Agrococcus sp. Ld7 TaxID=649148 RepID=UPI00386F17FA